MYPCPCCGYLTAEEPGDFEICPICFWQDNEAQTVDPTYDGGPNHLSLEEARRNYAEFGAKSRRVLKYVRKPLPEEIPS